MDTPWMVKLNSTSARCFSLIYRRMPFYLVPAFFSAGHPAGLAAGRADEAATKAPDI